MKAGSSAGGMLLLRAGMLLLGIAACVFLVDRYLLSSHVLNSPGELMIWPHGVLAFVMFVTHVLLVFFAWHHSLELVGVEVSPKLSAGIFLASLVTRYIPGGIWHLGSRLLAMSRLGRNSYLVGVTLVLEQLAAVAVCLLLVLLFIGGGRLFFPEIDRITAGDAVAGKAVLLATSVLLLGVLYPPVFRKLLAWVFKILKKQALAVPLSSMALYRLYGIHALSLLVFALGYQQVLAMVSGPAQPPVAMVAGIVLIATLLGYLAPFVPGGIGVRESLIVVLMLPYMDPADATAMAVLGRVLIIIVECFLLAVVVMGYRTGVES